MTIKLVGTSVTTWPYTAPVGYVHAAQYVCIAAGTLSEIKVYCKANSNVRVAIYSDSGSDTIGNLLKESASVAITAGDWRTIALPSTVELTLGTIYWLAVQVQTDGGCGYTSASQRRGYKTQAYGAFPASGSGFTIQVDTDWALQGWGTAVQILLPSSITQPITMGEPTVSLGSTGQTIAPSSIVQLIAIGTPTLLYPQTLLPSSITQAIAYGTPMLVLTIKPLSIVQAISVGTPIVTQP
ncbi:MAG: hypothetical protein MUO97_07175, partial [Dehalococcoidia bacterium]|nr:hypothetical protein [Dehalococcoidia bacterium]